MLLHLIFAYVLIVNANCSLHQYRRHAGNHLDNKQKNDILAQDRLNLKELRLLEKYDNILTAINDDAEGEKKEKAVEVEKNGKLKRSTFQGKDVQFQIIKKDIADNNAKEKIYDATKVNEFPADYDDSFEKSVVDNANEIKSDAKASLNFLTQLKELSSKDNVKDVYESSTNLRNSNVRLRDSTRDLKVQSKKGINELNDKVMSNAYQKRMVDEEKAETWSKDDTDILNNVLIQDVDLNMDGHNMMKNEQSTTSYWDEPDSADTNIVPIRDRADVLEDSSASYKDFSVKHKKMIRAHPMKHGGRYNKGKSRNLWLKHAKGKKDNSYKESDDEMSLDNAVIYWVSPQRKDQVRKKSVNKGLGTKRDEKVEMYYDDGSRWKKNYLDTDLSNNERNERYEYKRNGIQSMAKKDNLIQKEEQDVKENILDVDRDFALLFRDDNDGINSNNGVKRNVKGMMKENRRERDGISAMKIMK